VAKVVYDQAFRDRAISFLIGHAVSADVFAVTLDLSVSA